MEHLRRSIMLLKMKFKKFPTIFKPAPKQKLRNLTFLFLFVITPLLILFGNFSIISKMIALVQFAVFASYLTIKQS